MWIKRKISIYLQRFYVYIYGKFHKIEKKVLFDSFCGKQYSDNPRAISEKLHELYPGYKIVWRINNKNNKYNIIPAYIKIVFKNKDFLKELATSFCYVTNEGMEPNKYKKKNQLFIQTWHGDRGFKKVLYAAWEGAKRPIPVTDEKITDLCIAASDYGESVYRDAFKYKGKILKIGMPRNDKLVKKSPDEYEKIKKNINIPKDVKVLLFAPTYRDRCNTNQKILVDLKRVLEVLERNGEKWICLIRAHSASSGLEFNESDKVKDVTDYPDIADLLLIADMLITDYSSCSGDFILMDKPVILTLFDKNEYEKSCRKFNLKPEDAGYIIAYNQEELESIILNNTEKDYEENCKKIKKIYNVIETGDSSKEICNIIKEFYEHKGMVKINEI